MDTVISKEAKTIIEHNPLVIATTMPNGKPNAIAVVCVQVIDEQTLLVTDVYMHQTLKDIEHDNSVTLLVWDKDLNGYKMLGQATYFDNGEWLERVQANPENAELMPKGAMVIKVHSIFKTA